METVEKDYEMIKREFAEFQATSGKARKFINALVQLVISCHPDGYYMEEPTLKDVWSWLKYILEDYKRLMTDSKLNQKA